MNMFTKITLLIGIILIAISGLVFSQTTMSTGIYTTKSASGSVSGAEVGLDFGRFNLALRGGGSGIVVKTPTVDIHGDMSDSTGYTDSFDDTLFPGDGESIKGNVVLFNIECRASFDVVKTDFMSVFLGAGASWTQANITGKYVIDKDGNSVSVEGAVNTIGIPVFAGVESELFERAPGLIFGIEAGYLPQIPLNAEGTLSIHDDDGAGNWSNINYAIDVNPNMFIHGFYSGVYVKYRW